MSSVCLWISTLAVKRNFETLKQRCPGKTIAAVVKANAYGLGFGTIVPALAEAGCSVFLVNRLEEAVAVRRFADSATVYVLDAFAEGEEIDAYRRSGVTPVFSTVEALARYPREDDIALRLDLGFGLAGVPASDMPAVLAALNGRKVSFLIGHLSCAERPQDPQNEKELALFSEYAALFPSAQKSLSASFGMALGEKYWFDVVRAGAFLYGSSALEGSVPVARLSAKIGWVRYFEAGECLGYNRAHILTRRTLVASVLAGSGDGIVHRQGCFVDYRGALLPVIGVPTTNYLAIDASVCADLVRPGDDVDLFNMLYTPDDLAAGVGMEVGADVLIRLKESLPRRVI